MIPFNDFNTCAASSEPISYGQLAYATTIAGLLVVTAATLGKRLVKWFLTNKTAQPTSKSEEMSPCQQLSRNIDSHREFFFEVNVPLKDRAEYSNILFNRCSKLKIGNEVKFANDYSNLVTQINNFVNHICTKLSKTELKLFNRADIIVMKKTLLASNLKNRTDLSTTLDTCLQKLNSRA